MVTDANKPTTVKTRVIGNNHQLIRVDAEVDEVSNKEVSLKLFEAVQHIIEHQKINVIVFEDYDKGAISELLITKTVALAQSKGIPVAVDPKKRNFNHYKNVDLFKPNLKEIIEGLKIEFGFDDFLSELKRTHQMLQKNINHKASLITLSERGMFWMDNEITHLEKARFRNISDVSGAGDTVIGVAALCLALGLKGDELTAIANIAGGLVCEYVGVVPIDRKQFYEEVVKCLAVN
jgi:rfaE bifunctional protein kinase chain/domain